MTAQDQRQALLPTTATGLFWSESGEVTCGEHAPWPGSDSWLRGRWLAMTAADVDGWRAQVGRPPVCETCGLEAAVR